MPLSTHKNRVYGLLSRRNIAKKRGFCLFHKMKRLLILVLIAAGSVSEVSAMSCSDYNVVVKFTRQGVKELEVRRETIGKTVAEQCKFFTNEYLWSQRGFTWNVQHYKALCKEPIRSAAAAYYEELQETLTSIEDYNKANCPTKK